MILIFRAFSIIRSRAIHWNVPEKTPKWFAMDPRDATPDCFALVPIMDQMNHHEKVSIAFLEKNLV